MRLSVRRLIGLSFLLIPLFLTIGLPLWAYFGSVLPRGLFATKYYEFPQVVVDATVHQDGSMSVVEQRTYDFRKGEFHFAFREIDHRLDGDIVDFRVREGETEYLPWTAYSSGGPLDPGVLEIEDGFSTLKGTWRFVASGEQRTFVISYTALCAVNVYPDGAHLYWQFIPSGFDKPTDHVRVTIHLPGAATAAVDRPPGSCDPATGPGVDQDSIPTAPLADTEVRAWGHGPLQGTVERPDPQTIVLDIRHLPGLQFVEGSVLFPTSVVPLEPFTSSAYDPAGNRVSTAAEVITDEQHLADQANHKRQRLRVVDALWKNMAIWYVVSLGLLVIVARNRDRVPGIPSTLQDAPEQVHPVDLAVLWGAWHHTGLTMKNAYRAELLWLAKQRVIEVQAEGRVSSPKDIKLTLKDTPSNPYDVEFVEYLFPKGVGPVELSEVKAKGKRLTELRQWTKLVQKKSTAQRSRRHRRWETLPMWLGLIVVAVTMFVAAAELHQPEIGWLALPLFVVWVVARSLVPPRLPEDLRERVARWAAFRRFLKKFSSLPDAPAMAIIVWEQYLAYATALGVADRVSRQVKAVLPPDNVPAPWAGAPPGLNGYLWARSLSVDAPVTASIASATTSGISWSGSGGSSSSSGGFGGGGFSGGGGFGGGGGGGGAG